MENSESSKDKDDNDIVLIDNDDSSDKKSTEEAETKKDKIDAEVIDTINLDSPSPPPAKEFIDLDEYDEKKKEKIETNCINYDCQYGKDLILAPGWCLIYYKVKEQKRKQEICSKCFDEAFEFNKNLVQKLEENEFLIEQKFPTRHDLEIIDSDEEIEDLDFEHEAFSEEEQKMIEDEFNDVFNNVLNKYKFEDQVKFSETYLTEKMNRLKREFDDMDKEVNDLQKSVDSVRNDIYGMFKKPTRELQPIEIPGEISSMLNSPIKSLNVPKAIVHPQTSVPPVVNALFGQIKTIPQPVPILNSSEPSSTQVQFMSLRIEGNTVTPKVAENTTHAVPQPKVYEPKTYEPKYYEPKESPERRSHRNITKPVTYDETMDITDNNAIETSRSRSAQEGPSANSNETFNLPEKAPLRRPAPIVGENYYAMKSSPLGPWGKCRLVDIANNDDNTSSEILYKIKFDHRVKSNSFCTVSGKQLAYTERCNVRLEVGTRVIAVFHTGSANRDSYFAGIIAEPLSITNNHRYLIFFDDGYAQYVHHSRVLLVVEQSKFVHEDVHKDSRAFIKKYLESYPERAMLRLSRGQTFKTELAGKWLQSTVRMIDCSLVQIEFDNLARTEWIYRGSARLGPLYAEMQAALNRIEKGPHVRRAIVHKKNTPYVEYTRADGTESVIDVDQENRPAAPRAVAKKSTARPQPMPPNTPAKPNLPFLPTQQMTQPSSKVVYFSPKNPVDPVEFVPHTCSPECQKYVKLNLKQLRGYNPLSKPLLCGWHRLIYKYRGKKVIRYRAPCGRSIRSLEECHKYLRITNSDMSVDMFDFDYWVHCLAEFILEKTFRNKKDFSNGEELVPIPCVNYVDNTMPDFCNYSTKREPMEGVNLNLDPDFLCGCDCEDDCLDKQKCQCWQLTIREYRTLNKKDPDETIGYYYKRLPEFVTTGIYECNSRCKCASTCLNRVVQHPLQLKLQLFKTANRGWGIRGLNDIPKGAFICIYAGNLLTDKMANEGGTNYGDEYLAELDYIEVVERQKEGYESDVEDIEEDESPKNKEDEEDEEMPILGRTEEDDTEFVCGAKVDHNLAVKTRSRRKRGQNNDDNSETSENTESKMIEGENNSGGNSDDEDSNVREPMSFDPSATSEPMDDSNAPLKFKSVRKMFGEDEFCYIMDAKNTGNIGRFLNHSCSPNVFVQNVFVDTHDLRFPWVAFFAMSYIRAGTELTWNYNYDVGSVPGKVIFCHCGSSECRGRLL